jgi:intracellular septation protein
MVSKKLLVNALCEFGPVMAFLITYQVYGFMPGVVAMMIATVISFFVLRHVERHTPIFALISSGSVLIFGGISLFVNIPSIFILRDTLFDVIFGFVIIVSVLIKKPLFKYIFGGVFAITDRGWSIFSLRWGIFFVILAAINEWIRLQLSPDDWVLAKVLMVIASTIFGIYQLTLTKKERLPTATSWGVVN